MKTLKSHIDLLVQAVLWGLMLLIHFLSALSSGATWKDSLWVVIYSVPYFLIYVIIFYANYLWFIPRFLFRKRYWQMVVANVALGILLNAQFIVYTSWHESLSQVPIGMRAIMGLAIGIITILFILAAIGLRVQKRNAQLELEATVAERERLKNQLNPHFLFNTLNNISSLAAFDPDATQTAIARLSDMLRYVLYEGSKPLTPITDELRFMEDYVELMRLRYADMLHIHLDFNEVEGEVPPLLYISLLENAFKHGASSRHPCHIAASFTAEGEWLCFAVANSLPNNDVPSSKESGGVGIENLRRRLSLLYPPADYVLDIREKASRSFGEGMPEQPAYTATLQIKRKKK